MIFLMLLGFSLFEMFLKSLLRFEEILLVFEIVLSDVILDNNVRICVMIMKVIYVKYKIDIVYENDNIVVLFFKF